MKRNGTKAVKLEQSTRGARGIVLPELIEIYGTPLLPRLIVERRQ